MPSSSKAPRVRPSEVAAHTKKHFIPQVDAQFRDLWPPYSILYEEPTWQLPIPRSLSTLPPSFHIETGDPVMKAIYQASVTGTRIPFICAANERRPGGDWETGCAGYEERFCRRSNLSATLSTPHPESPSRRSYYPIPLRGGIISDFVAVGRGPHDRYEKLDTWYDLPVVSVPPTRWPKLKDHGSKYSFAAERDMIKEKIRGALHICLHHRYNRVVVGDFGLGNGYRNPPQELAEIWRDIFLFDPDLRGHFRDVTFVFEDPAQSTMKLIHDEAARKESKGSRHKSRASSTESSSSRGSSGLPTDIDIFEWVFDPSEIGRVRHSKDPRYGLDMITC